MLPAFILRTGVDWVRHDQGLKESNPYARCEQAIKISQALGERQFGKVQLGLLELAIVTAYWEEFFHAEDPLPDELEWREGLSKRSSHYDSFEDWQDWFKKEYRKLYKDNNIWNCALLTAWAHTHQYDVRYTEETWTFLPSRSYLPTSQMWRLEPHLCAVTEILQHLWRQETATYASYRFRIDETSLPYLGRIECLGFDTKRYMLSYPPKANRDAELLDMGEMVANIVMPQGDDWYRHLDNIIFADNCLDVTALINRGRYILGSRRRILELGLDKDAGAARMQAQAEGWLVSESELPEEAKTN